jgi:hypothetical protein
LSLRWPIFGSNDVRASSTGFPMNYSILTADWRTHAKMLIIALLAGTAFVCIGTKAQVSALEPSLAAASGPVVKASQRPIYSNRETVVTR